MPYLPVILGLFSLITLSFFFLAPDIFNALSPQGCGMSWMSPSYVLQTPFDASWTPLANRYSLSLYREVGWDPNEVQGTPVLFIPGNAGSSHQVRSIASSATRQFYSSPSVVAPEFLSRTLKPLDFFAAEFNEDLSAFHGPTLGSQIAYASHAISYILSLYPTNTSIIVMGHSMGGIVATSLLPSSNISAIITMSTPHTLPPARFDSHIDRIYRDHKETLISDPTPILSLCGGATDLMISSESCILPTTGPKDAFRQTVFTSALEGAWTGVGHREMVWCHQVRWRVARAALEIGAATSSSEKGNILDTWLPAGRTVPPNASAPVNGVTKETRYEVLSDDEPLALARPRGSSMHLLPIPVAPSIPSTSVLKAVLFVGLGTIAPYPSHTLHPMRVSVLLCTKSTIGLNQTGSCNRLKPSFLQLMPNPMPGTIFPVPEQGSSESGGMTVFEADIPLLDPEAQVQQSLGVRIEGGEGKGFVFGGLSKENEVIIPSSIFSFLFGHVDFTFPDKVGLRTRFILPNALSSALIVYKYSPIRPEQMPWCSDPLVSPLIMHTSQPSETHYFPINALDRQILLHDHSSAPYISPTSPHGNLDFVIYSSGTISCTMIGFSISVDWPATLGRWASRYPTTLVTWTIGVAAIILFNAWRVSDYGAVMPTVERSLSTYSRRTLGKVLVCSLLIGTLPIPVEYYLGMGGEIIFAPIAPLLFLTASGLICASWGLLVFLMWPLGVVSTLFSPRPGPRPRVIGVRKSTIISMAFIFALIFLFIPWQVAYLGCWFIHLCTCASSARHISLLAAATNTVKPVVRDSDAGNDVRADKGEAVVVRNPESRGSVASPQMIDNHNHDMHLLLLMTWLLPLVAPVLAVWVRTLATAGLTIPFDSDHNFLNVAPFLILVDFASWNTNTHFERQRFESVLSVRWCWAVLAAIAVFVGPRWAYSVFDGAKIAFGLIVVIRVGPRYWGGVPWASKREN